MYVGLRLLRMLSNENLSISELIRAYPNTYSTPETRFDVDESKKFSIIDEVKDEKWTWKIYREITLGNKKTGSQTQYFKVNLNMTDLL